MNLIEKVCQVIVSSINTESSLPELSKVTESMSKFLEGEKEFYHIVFYPTHYGVKTYIRSKKESDEDFKYNVRSLIGGKVEWYVVIACSVISVVSKDKLPYPANLLLENENIPAGFKMSITKELVSQYPGILERKEFISVFLMDIEKDKSYMEVIPYEENGKKIHLVTNESSSKLQAELKSSLTDSKATVTGMLTELGHKLVGRG